jgi:hypothetical protein
MNGSNFARAKAGRACILVHHSATRGCFVSLTSSGAIPSSIRFTNGTAGLCRRSNRRRRPASRRVSGRPPSGPATAIPVWPAPLRVLLRLFIGIMHPCSLRQMRRRPFRAAGRRICAARTAARFTTRWGRSLRCRDSISWSMSWHLRLRLATGRCPSKSSTSSGKMLPFSMAAGWCCRARTSMWLGTATHCRPIALR